MRPMISIIIPIFNEEKQLPDLLEHLQAITLNKNTEILFVDGGSQDRSVELIHSNSTFRAVVSTKSGRAAQMNYGATLATGQILYFVHADTRILESFEQDILDCLESGYEVGCYAYTFDSNHILLKANSWFTQFDGIFSGGGDQTLFVTKKCFQQLNGFDEYYSLMEDFDFTRRARTMTKFKIIPKKIKVSARKYEKNSWLRVQIVNLLTFIGFYLKLHPDKLKSFYKNHLSF
jgi:rSAM/selenodomain-associated transferase 2